MKRFYQMRSDQNKLLPAISLIVFAVIILCFSLGVKKLGVNTSNQGKQLLQEHLQQEISLCYALEGQYPPDLDYLLEHYPISYDPDRYYIGYEIYGSNLSPDVTVIER